MRFGRGWFGWGGMGMGRGMGFGRGMGMGRGFGLGRGNPYPFCRFYPWLPRRWWAYGGGYYPTAQPWAYGGGYYPTAQPRTYGVSPYYGAPLSYPW